MLAEMTVALIAVVNAYATVGGGVVTDWPARSDGEYLIPITYIAPGVAPATWIVDKPSEERNVVARWLALLAQLALYSTIWFVPWTGIAVHALVFDWETVTVKVAAGATIAL